MRSGTLRVKGRHAPLQWIGALFAVALLALLVSAPEAHAVQAEAQATEYQVKAAYLYKFIGYVDWSSHAQASSGSSMVIGVIGADSVADELRQVVASHDSRDRPISVRTLAQGDSLAGVQMLFIGGRATGLAALLAAASESDVLTITESEDAFAMGSVINFVTVGDKVRFDIALQAADAAHLRISSRLLAVARRVV